MLFLFRESLDKLEADFLRMLDPNETFSQKFLKGRKVVTEAGAGGS